MLNVDVTNKIGVDEGFVVEFIEKVLRSDRDYNPCHILLNEKRHFDAFDIEKKGLKVRYSRPGEYKRDYQAIRMMAVSSQLKMKQRNEEECTIEKYVKNKYRYQLRFLDYLCLYVGNLEDKVYLPEEAISILNIK